MDKMYYAHYRHEDETYQTLPEHSVNVANLSETYCAIPLLKKTARIAGLIHDAGKGRSDWVAYFESSVHSSGTNEKIDHSTYGGAIMASVQPSGLFSEVVEDAVYMHHGLSDCVSLNDHSSLLARRRNKFPQACPEDLKAVCGMSAPEFLKVYKAAQQDFLKLADHIKKMRENSRCTPDNCNFYLGMCERYILSCLMDADWRDTADFMDGKKTKAGLDETKVRQFWEAGVEAIERKEASFKVQAPIDLQKERISRQCMEAAAQTDNLYRLAVPTGAGKTLSSLRFALHRAKKRNKRHIFYIAPFKSLLDQNAKVIKETLGSPYMILEHHGDVICESQGAEDRYERLIENWDEVPVIVTTAVQFFNTLFKEKRSNIRRFHSLADSVIIMDEVQAIPVKLIHLFNLAVNFLTRICDTTVVLCTATQPLFDKLQVNRMFPLTDMTDGLKDYEPYFRRVEYHDETDLFPEGLTLETAADLVRQKAHQFGQVLMIVNTRSCAKRIYQELKGTVQGKLFHLSNSLCPANRMAILEQIRQSLDKQEPVICITTQLVEAGIDFDFRCVIRSMAGLDNMIQAAGRSNRYGKPEMGQVFLVRMSPQMEKVDRLLDIRESQGAMKKLLYKYHQNPEKFDDRLDSQKAIDEFYSIYFHERESEMGYPLKEPVAGISGLSLVELLSGNGKFAPKDGKVILKQAFATAGQRFCALEDSGGRDVVVEYGESCKWLEQLQQMDDSNKRKAILRQLQQYLVKVPEGMIKRLGNAMYGIEDGRILVLRKEFYDEETGVQEEPGDMEFLNF